MEHWTLSPRQSTQAQGPGNTSSLRGQATGTGAGGQTHGYQLFLLIKLYNFDVHRR